MLSEYNSFALKKKVFNILCTSVYKSAVQGRDFSSRAEDANITVESFFISLPFSYFCSPVDTPAEYMAFSVAVFCPSTAVYEKKNAWLFFFSSVIVQTAVVSRLLNHTNDVMHADYFP